jgi:hypothetical protein
MNENRGSRIVSAWRAALCGVSIFAAALAFAGQGDGVGFQASDAVPLAVSEDLGQVLVTNAVSQGLELLEPATGQSVLVTKQAGSGNYATISADGRFVCFKAFEPNGGDLQQVPMLFDIGAGKAIPLCKAAPLAGTPAVTADGKVFYTLGEELVVLNSDLSVAQTIGLGLYVNLVAPSPDGKSVAFAEDNGSIVMVNVATGAKRTAVKGQGLCWGPKFSPKGDKILASTVDGKIICAAGGRAKMIGQGESPAWLDNDTIGFTQKTVANGQVAKTSVVAVTSAGQNKGTLLSENGDASAVTGAGNVAIAVGSKVRYGYVKNGVAKLVDAGSPKGLTVDASGATAAPGVPSLKGVVDKGNSIELSGVPYLHQVYDTADWFNGNSACGASSALMAIQYFAKLPNHPITCSTPSSHTHNFGWYVSEQYTFNGHTYNKPSADPNGRTAYGGFGYITQNGWEDTKGHMAEYISYHGPTSSVDWSPTWAEAQTEINANHPFVILTSLTSAGHYICCIGFFKAQHTLVFNDPYGNKNSGYMNYSGTRVFYDWPGYSNGYSNLNTVHCFIYCKATQSNPVPAAPTNLAATAVSASQINLTWTDNSGVETNFVVGRSTASGGPFTDIATLGANVTSYSNTGLSANTRYYYVVRAKNAAGNSANSNTANALTWPATVTVDNSNAGFTCSANWATGTSATDKYGTDYRYRSTAAVSDQAVWTYSVPQTRNYEVYAWWSAGTNRSATAPYTVSYSGGSQAVSKNQQANGGSWQSLGTFNLTAGTNTVKLSCWTTAGFVVIADAIRVVPR